MLPATERGEVEDLNHQPYEVDNLGDAECRAFREDGVGQVGQHMEALALESREPASLACRQFACPQAVFDYEKKKKNSFCPYKTTGSLVIT